MSVSAHLVIGALPAGARLFEYEVERVLGQGGFGITYLARDLHLQKTVAIKEYLPADLALRVDGAEVCVRSEDAREPFAWGREHFLVEARVLARFHHPNLMQVHRFFEANGTAYFVMDYAEGEPLDLLLRRCKTLPQDELLALLLPLLDGLERVHRDGILHRDIKPGNIIRRLSGAPVLIDFGSARQDLSARTRSIISTITGGYAPLEQYATAGDQGPWTDLYALGAVAYRAVSGKRPIDAVARVREDPLVPAAMLGQGRYAPVILEAIDWAMAVHGEDRPRSVRDWRLALQGTADVDASGPVVRPPMAEATELLSPEQRDADDSAPPTLSRMHAGPGQAALPAGPVRAWRRRGLRSAGAILLLGAVGAAWLWQPRPAPSTARQSPAAATSMETPLATTPPPAGAVPTPPAPVRSLAEAPPASAPARVQPAKQPKPAQKKDPAPQRLPVAQMASLSSFRDCPACPLMVALPAGSYAMGAAGDGANAWEQPLHKVRLPRPFALARFELSVAEWQACAAAGSCPPAAEAGDAKLPVVQVSWDDARSYAAWLSRASGRAYRLPTEAEWEYALRAGTQTNRYWGSSRSGQCEHANAADFSARRLLDRKAPVADCDDGHSGRAAVGQFRANAFGLHDMAGNVWEWTLDCWRDSYAGAPRDGSAVVTGNCPRHVIRGGSWRTKPESLRSASRGLSDSGLRSDDLGLRVLAE